MLFRQVMISIVSSATLLASGMNLGFSAVALPHMQDAAGPDKLTVDEGSWFASISFVTTLVGCLTCGPLMDRLGRKRTLLIVNFPFIIGWLLMWVAPKPAPISLLYLARLLNGLGGGMISIPANIYIAEMATSSMRCMLVTWPSLAISIGILLVYGLGLIIDEWRTIAAISTFVPIITAFLILVYIRESPIWLLAKRCDKEAEKSFRWIRCINRNDEMPQEYRNEFDNIVENSRKLSSDNNRTYSADTEDPGVSLPLRRNSETYYGANGANEVTTVRQTTNDKFSSVFSTLKRPDVWKPLVILNTYFFFMQFSGVPVLIAYAVNIMMSEGVSLEPYLATLLFGIVKLVFEIIAGFVQNRCGRRPLSVWSGIGMGFCMMGLGLHHQLIVNVEDKEEKQILSWIPLILIMAYAISAAVGFFLIPWAMLGEVYPTKVAGLACGITTCLGNFFGFTSIKLFPTIVVLLGGTANGNTINSTEGVFYLYGGITGIAVLFIHFYLPETFRKTFQEISDGFMKPRKRRLYFL